MLFVRRFGPWLLLASVVAYVLLAEKTWTVEVVDERWTPLADATLVLLREGEVVDTLVLGPGGVGEVAVGRTPWDHEWAVIACKPGWRATAIVKRTGRQAHQRPMTSSTSTVMLFPRVLPQLEPALAPYAASLPASCFR